MDGQWRQWKGSRAERVARAFKLAREFDEILPHIADPVPPWAPSLLIEPKPIFWGQPKKLRRVA